MLQEFLGMCGGGGGGRDEGVEAAVSRTALYLYDDGRAVIKKDGERPSASGLWLWPVRDYCTESRFPGIR